MPSAGLVTLTHFFLKRRAEQVLHGVDQVGEGAAEAVELPDDEHVARPARAHAAAPATGSRLLSRRGRSRSACVVNGRLRYDGEGAVRQAPQSRGTLNEEWPVTVLGQPAIRLSSNCRSGMTELETRLTDALKALSTQWDADQQHIQDRKQTWNGPDL